jgi:hypothetical protein
MLPPLGIYIEGEARQATYILNCSREFILEQDLAIRKFSKRVVLYFGPKGQDCSYYCFWKKLLAELGNIGNLAIR